MLQYTAIILARAGSVRLLGKNMLPMCCRPLVEWTIMAAKTCPKINDVIVSTDWFAVAEVAADYRCHIVQRPARLCQPLTTSYEAIRDAIEAKGANGHIVLLQPTSPNRNAWDLYCFLEAYERCPSEPWASANPGGKVPNGAIYAAPQRFLSDPTFTWDSPDTNLHYGRYFPDIDEQEDFAEAEAIMKEELKFRWI